MYPDSYFRKTLGNYLNGSKMHVDEDYFKMYIPNSLLVEDPGKINRISNRLKNIATYAGQNLSRDNMYTTTVAWKLNKKEK